MADEPNGISDGKKPKRRLRVVGGGSGETVRERTEKLQQKAEAPKRPSKFRAFWGGFFWPLRWLGRQIAKLNRFRLFRWIGYVFVPPYIRNSWKELKLVTWPNFRETLRLVYAVIIFSIIFGLVVAGLDWILTKVFKEIILR